MKGQGYPRLRSKFEASLGYLGPSLKKKKKQLTGFKRASLGKGGEGRPSRVLVVWPANRLTPPKPG